MVDDRMQAPPSDFDPRSDLDPERVREFVTDRWTTPHCECCGTNEWGLAEAVQGQTAGLLVPQSDGRFDGKAEVRRVVVLTCGRCGNTRLINPWAIRRWHDAKEAAR